MTTAERLRLYAQQFEDQHAPQNITIGLREAADEIERLRGQAEFEKKCRNDAFDELKKQDAEIERLKRSRDRYRGAWEEEKRRFTEARAALDYRKMEGL